MSGKESIFVSPSAKHSPKEDHFIEGDVHGKNVKDPCTTDALFQRDRDNLENIIATLNSV